jgi:hypothetical protein
VFPADTYLAEAGAEWDDEEQVKKK